MPTISVIVPVYRAEAVLPTCVESVKGQTFTDWELLLIDDGSTDQSGKLCDRFAVEDARIRVFHKGNGGVSSARNLGMAEAQGDYILFLDADDWLDTEMCQTLFDQISQSGSDSAGCAHWNIQPSGEKWKEPGALPAGVYDKAAIQTGIVARLLGQRLGKPGEVLNGFIWRFLFSRAVIAENDIRFSGAYLEDELFLMEYFCQARQLVMVDAPLYYYLQNPNSVTRNYLPGYMDTFRRFLQEKRKLAARFSLDSDDREWVRSTCWAGLLIAIGNEYAPGNSASYREKRHRVEAFTLEKDMADAIKGMKPKGLSRNKQVVVFLVRWRLFHLLSMLYKLKNR